MNFVRWLGVAARWASALAVEQARGWRSLRSTGVPRRRKGMRCRSPSTGASSLRRGAQTPEPKSRAALTERSPSTTRPPRSIRRPPIP